MFSRNFDFHILDEDDERNSDDTDLIDDFAPTDHFDYPTRPTRPPRSRRPQFSRPQRPPYFHNEDDHDLEDYFPGQISYIFVNKIELVVYNYATVFLFST